MTETRTREQRVFFRLPVAIPVRFRLGGTGPWRQGTTANLSCGGMLLETDHVSAGEKDRILGDRAGIEVQLDVERSGAGLRTTARAAWCEDGADARSPGRIGLQFVKIAAADEQRIRSLLHRRARELAQGEAP